MAKLTGGDKLSKKLTELAGMVTAGQSMVRVGFLAGATYPSTPGKSLTTKKLTAVMSGQSTRTGKGSPGGKPVAMIAAIQEFGAPRAGIPPRPFFRNMIAAKKKEWPGAMAQLLKDNNYNVGKMFAKTGEAVAGQLRQSIINTNSPPLKPATIARKGFSKPLIDTGHLINSISYEVVG